LKLVERKHINIERWDALVESTPSASVFSLSAYLDAVAENWSVLVDDEYRAGMVLPFAVRFGVKTLYTPIFARYTEWLGLPLQGEQIVEEIRKYFPEAQFNFNGDLPGLTSNEFVFQVIEPGKERATYGSQAKRMLSKFEKSGMSIHESQEDEEVLARIRKELPSKVSALNDRSLDRLDQLISDLRKKGFLRILEVKDGEKTVGGIFLVEFNKRVLYLKGAFAEKSKKEGAMYGAMDFAIKMAMNRDLMFDFGGSRVDGVRTFNCNLGGKDQLYFEYRWDNAPRWFSWLKKANRTWKRK
jgi:hypothetical protein